ncbi:hypothetical protein ARMSODRAFT_698430 [Armillaria solidipes]|uniref:Uncharacterized protein n=1 Tax=Armillaria solidipes TaxID=1076256 RepID=A0A2H3BUW3_9AGAR|nr:hypothetical protein ARMSODRAFT_698430 [Armillaria solidipes]
MRKFSDTILCLMQCLQSQTTDCHRRSVIRPTIQLISHVLLSTSAGSQSASFIADLSGHGFVPVSSNSKFSLALRPIIFTLRHPHLISLAIGRFATPTSANPSEKLNTEYGPDFRRRGLLPDVGSNSGLGALRFRRWHTAYWIGGIVVAGVLNFRGGEDF